MKEVTYEFGFGDIYSVSKDAIAYAKKHQTRDMGPVRVSFVFNEIEVVAYSSSEVLDIAQKYFLQNKIRRLELGIKD